jgi:signal transduction histidine kinase
MASDPFPHLAIHLMPAHWVVTGLSYALTAIGFYMLFELFSESNLDTKRLSVLVVLTGLPAVLDILSYTGNIFLTMNYEPVGVAVFGVGALYVIDEQFTALPAFWRQDVLEALDDPVFVFGRDGEIRDYNAATLDYFPELEQIKGQSLADVYPVLAADLTDGDDLVEIDHSGETRYFAVEREALTIGREEFGRVVILSDVTTIERQRRELQLQNDQFGDLAVIITHELRNLLTVIRGHMDLSASQLGDNGETPLRESYERGITAAERMEQVTTDLAKLTQYGQASQNRTQCDLQAVVKKGWQDAETDGMSLSIDTSGSVYGQRPHLIDLFSNVFDFTQALGASAVSVSVEEDRIVITSDGTPLCGDDIEAAFTYGEAVPSPETGMLLPMVRAIVRAHSWTVDITQDDNAVSLRISTE